MSQFIRKFAPFRIYNRLVAFLCARAYIWALLFQYRLILSYSGTDCDSVQLCNMQMRFPHERATKWFTCLIISIERQSLCLICVMHNNVLGVTRYIAATARKRLLTSCRGLENLLCLLYIEISLAITCECLSTFVIRVLWLWLKSILSNNDFFFLMQLLSDSEKNTYRENYSYWDELQIYKRNRNWYFVKYEILYSERSLWEVTLSSTRKFLYRICDCHLWNLRQCAFWITLCIFWMKQLFATFRTKCICK